jgi:DNA helicase-2/ATP-dependent DNA helicase PcrA
MAFEYHLKPYQSSDVPPIDYEAVLNEDQIKAVKAEPGPLLVIAGAGSGKTRTLTYRVAYLVENGIEPENILLLTFTNKASKEMIRRVEELLPCDVSRLWGGTFHHVANRILRRHANVLGYSQDFTIIDREDAEDVMKSAIGEADVDLKDKRFPKAQMLLDIYSLSVNTEKHFSDIINEQYSHLNDFVPTITKVFELYFSKKKEIGVMDYDDLLVLSLRLMQNNPDILEIYQKKFQHILVDEYQDTNKIQSDFIDILGAKHHQIMAVGDDAQSIYSWRGANFQNIMDFPNRHPNTQIIRIEINYRSTPEILTLANASIANNTNQFPKELRSHKNSGVKPALLALYDSRQQAQFIAQRIMELHEEGTNLSDIAILYRSHYHSMELQMELTRRSIPFFITSGMKFFEQAHIKDIAAYLKLMLNPKDELSFKRIALTLPGIGAKTAHKMWTDALSGKPWNTIKVPDKAQKFWEQWTLTQSQLNESKNINSTADCIQLVIDSIYEEYVKTQYANFRNRLEDLGQLVNFSRNFKEMSEFLSQLSLMSNAEAEPDPKDDGFKDNDYVRLTSIHQAKGLEWKVVFVMMLCDGLFPSARSLDSQVNEEEERRLFYVAVTRAQDELYMTYPQIRSTPGSGDLWQKPSRFLNEFSQDLCNQWTIKNSWDNA